MDDFSARRSSEKPQEIAIRSTLVIASTEYKYVADVVMDLAPDLPPVTCHGSQINQVVLNLVVNAAHAIGDVVKGTPDKGRITVRTQVVEDFVMISVGDTGGGIPEEVQRRLFQPGRSGKPGGTGLGLAISHLLALEIGADLSLVGTSAAGTTFAVTLNPGAPARA